MADIQIDMFEVQLGAAVLLQMKDSTGSTVRVLADGGIKAAGYPQDHVATRLGATLPSNRIDVLIGTHYDQDHLAGLVDVAARFVIGEAILPPIRRPKLAGLASRFAALPDAGDEEDASDLPYLIDLNDEEFQNHIDDLNEIAFHAESQLRDILPEEIGDPDLEKEILPPDEEFDADTGTAPLSSGNMLLFARQLVRIRASAHRGAIVAKWLQLLVQTLKSNGVPIRALDISAGVPEFFEWDTTKRSFASTTSSQYASSNEVKFTLLGPSRQLIAHHAKRLPIGIYFTLHGQVPLKPVTASNQLSYVMMFESAGQKILIAGDAGCADFWDKKAKGYHSALITAIKEPHVVQIAHHAGSNHRFYDVLLASGYATGSFPHSYLLLSHASNDSLRPSKEFDSFVSTLPSGQQFRLLTTSQPDPVKVLPFKSFYYPATHFPSAAVGDVQLSFQNGSWNVDQHLVQV